MSDFYIPYGKVKSGKDFQIHGERRNWGMWRLNIQEFEGKLSGENIKVAIIDSGIAKSDDLTATDTANFTTEQPSKDVTDKLGHGTHIAGIVAANHNGKLVAGIAPDVELYIAKVIKDGEESASKESVGRAIEWAISKQVNIINISLAARDSFPEIEAAIHEAVKQQIFVVCAAGDTKKGAYVQFPAKMPETIAVGAVGRNRKLKLFPCLFSPKSRYNAVEPEADKIDIVAPGEGILSTFLNNSDAEFDGTSCAAPFVTGVLALYLQKYQEEHPGVQPQVDIVKQRLKEQAKKLPHATPEKTGAGLVRPVNFINTISSTLKSRSIMSTTHTHDEDIGAPVSTIELPSTCPWPPLKPFIYLLNNNNPNTTDTKNAKYLYYYFTLEDHQYVEDYKVGYKNTAEMDEDGKPFIVLTFQFIIGVYKHGQRVVNKVPTCGMIPLPKTFTTDRERGVKDWDEIKVDVHLGEEHHQHLHSDLDPITHDGTSTTHGGDGDDDGITGP